MNKNEDLLFIRLESNSEKGFTYIDVSEIAAVAPNNGDSSLIYLKGGGVRQSTTGRASAIRVKENSSTVIEAMSEAFKKFGRT